MAMQMGMEDEELLLPPSTTPVEITPHLGRDEALHGGGDEDVDTGSSTELPPTPALPARKPLLTTFKTAIAAAVGRHKTEIIARDAFGKEVKKTLNSQDVTELENKAFAELQLSETKDKWNIKDENLKGWQKFGKGVERFFDRMWRGTATENFHRVKEYKHGLKLSATAGIEGAISAEFNTEIDRLARKRIEDERQGFWKKTFGKAKDLWQETFAQERDLHKYKVEATTKLRADFEANPTDPTNPIFHLINRDIAAREEVAMRLRETPLELLKESHTKNTKVESIKLDGEAGKKVENFLKEKILARVIDDALARNLDRTKPNRISDTLRPELDRQLQDYFFSDEFQAWRKTLTPEQQAAFENSFTYATDVLNQAESVLIPSVLDNVDHYQNNDRLNFDIELTLGTTQYSANSEAKGNEWGARSERASMNQAIWDKTRRAITSSSEATYPYRSQGVTEGLKRERFLSAVSGIVSNEVVAATTGLLVTKGAMGLAHSTIGWIPFLGSGIAAGAASSYKEWGRLNRMRAQYGFEESIGLSHPQAVNAKKSEQMRKVDYHRIELGRRVQQLSDMTEKLNSGSYTDTDLLQTLGYLADSKARVKLGDHYGINLLTASKDTPDGRAIYQREVRLHDLARATTTTKLKEIIDSNGALGQSLGEKLGLLPGTVHQTDQILAILSQNLEVNLETGTQIPTELQVALGSLTIQEAESIQARDQAFNKLRWGSSVLKGSITGLLAGGLSAGLHQFADAHETVVTTNTNTVEMEVFNHTLPTHTDTLNGIGHMTHPDTGEVITMHAQLPHGTHLVVDPIRVGGPDDMETAYNLVGANNEVLVRGMQFTGDGHLQMTHEIRDALAHNHINYEAHPLSPITWATEHNTTTTTEIDPSQWTHSLTYEQMGGAPDTFFNNNVNQILQSHPEYADVDNSTFINGLRYTLRGMENHIYHNNNVHINQIEGFPRDVHFRDSIWGSEFVIAPQADNAEITNLPDFIATAEGNEHVMRLIHESIEQYKATETFTDEAHRIAYEMSHIGTENHVPDENEIKILVEYLGGNSTHDQLVEHVSHTITPHDAWFTATETLTRPVEIPVESTYAMTPVEWWNTLIPTGFARPLEAPTGNIKVAPPTLISSPVVTPTPYRPSYGYGYRGSTWGSVNNIQIETTEEQRIRQNLPNLLVQAFQQWDTPESDKEHVLGLTWPEQYDWLQNQSRINMAPPTQPTPVQPPANNPITIDTLAAQLGADLTPVVSEPTPTPPIEEVQTPAIDSNKSSIPELELFIADENDSPVKPEDKAEAIVRMKEFASLGDLDEAVAKNGIKKEAALSMYQEMIQWMKIHKVADIESDNSSFDKSTYDKIQTFAKSTFWTPNPNPLAVKQLSNALMNLVLEFGSKYHLNDNSSEDANTANMFVLFAAYERVKETKYRD